MLIVDDLLINLPIKGFFGLLKKIQDMAEDELYDPKKIKEALAQLNEAYEAEEVNKEEFLRCEKKLLKRLEIGVERKKGGDF